MLPRNIDLTENRDFSGGGEIFMDTIIEIPLSEYQLMTCDEYEKLRWWEGIFGRKRHYTEKDQVFDVEGKYVNKWKHHCYRCGELIRIPWLNFNSVCHKCNDILKNGGRIPWKEQKTFGTFRNVAYDLFNRR